MSLIESLLKTYKDNINNSGLHSGQRISDKDGKLKPDPNTDNIDNINFKTVDGGAKKNKVNFDKEVNASIKGTKPATEEK